MRRTARTVVGGAVGITAALAAAYGLIVRPWHLRWGATRDEIERPLPFDSVVPHPNYFTTRAITIDAPPEKVWPWLVQMGELPRAGFYSYTWIEKLMGMKIENADRILPDFQELKPGDRLDRAGNMLVRAVKQPAFLVLGPPEGLPTGEITWAIVLEPTNEGGTRLISRCRARFAPNARSIAWYAILDPGQFIMERKWMVTVKELAERR